MELLFNLRAKYYCTLEKRRLSKMKILAVGDIVGKTGIQKLKETLPEVIKENNIDFVIVNGENAAEGMGLTEKMYREILDLNVNVVTMGNHT